MEEARVTCPYISPLSFYIIIKKNEKWKNSVHVNTLKYVYMEGGEEN